MRVIATMLIVAQALAPAAAWGQDTRAAPKAPAPAAAPKGPAPAPAAAPAQAPAPAQAAKGPPAAPAGATTRPVVDRRLALVVGNNTYQNAPLVNPINDARLVAKTLEGLGFEVMLRENLNLRDFKAVMRQFASRLENEEGTGLLYYAGHGVQIEGRNFLLP
ncbi:MAG: caspase family protein, partial [Burkholderiales bacterium]|nr:caspase family protein [Burkholderiales bacterium]